jgi:hypothetical protein
MLLTARGCDSLSTLSFRKSQHNPQSDLHAIIDSHYKQLSQSPVGQRPARPHSLGEVAEAR